jgi:hypothetical protein
MRWEFVNLQTGKPVKPRTVRTIGKTKVRTISNGTAIVVGAPAAPAASNEVKKAAATGDLSKGLRSK